jgi:hypothetical protein
LEWQRLVWMVCRMRERFAQEYRKSRRINLRISPFWFFVGWELEQIDVMLTIELPKRMPVKMWNCGLARVGMPFGGIRCIFSVYFVDGVSAGLGGRA